MEPTTGIEPVDLFLTKEALYLLSYVGISICNGSTFTRSSTVANKNTRHNGAGDENRTRDSQLGRLMLYQLSYSRTWDRHACKGQKNPGLDYSRKEKAIALSQLYIPITF